MRAVLFGCPIDIVTMAETIDRVTKAMRERTRLHHVALNVAKLISMRRDPDLDADVRNCDLIGIDGMGIVLAARLFGLPARERVAGIDLMDEVLKLCAQQGFRPYFLGGTQIIVRAAATAASAKYPALEIAGVRDGYFEPHQAREVVAEIRASKADCLFVGMPTPKKERFLASYRDQIGVPFIMGVGGSFDILAGHVARAPLYMQRFGMEWLFRIYQEPRRMWWRYTKTNTIFAGLLLRAIFRRSGHGY
jgi:N-acetylglucosaminyldiphosphoundecaprenol N-acetyl-beta-D-mannosaminyltransferase